MREIQDEPWEELIDGKTIIISPCPSILHNQIAGNITCLFTRYLWNKSSRPFARNMLLCLTEKNHFIPDFMVVSDPEKVKWDCVEGAPDLVIEVLSPGTVRNDRGYKKDVYERCGVREYWIVSPREMSIEQYVLENGAFTLRDIYYHYPAYMTESMTDAERASLVTQFQCTLFDDLSIRLEDVFYRVSG